jgi:hypothetical protein
LRWTNSSDFWRAIKERHPSALTIARRPRISRGDPLKSPDSYLTNRAVPDLPPRIKTSFLRRHTSSPSSSSLANRTSDAPHELLELPFRGAQFRILHNTFPRTQHQFQANMYLHTPKRESEFPELSTLSKYRRMLLPSLTATPIPFTPDCLCLSVSVHPKLRGCHCKVAFKPTDVQRIT